MRRFDLCQYNIRQLPEYKAFGSASDRLAGSLLGRAHLPDAFSGLSLSGLAINKRQEDRSTSGEEEALVMVDA